ncbi:hypothetical protein SAMN05192571_110156 [Pleomorphomonas diazotrophica]|nr:hypothetical protein SAMN05192571_110156 [Pleomorphomonas diazotrophica]
MLAVSWGKCDVYDVALVFGQHVVAIFAVVKTPVFTGHAKTTIKYFFNISKIKAML